MNVHLYFELNNPNAKNEKIFSQIAKILEQKKTDNFFETKQKLIP